LGISNAYIGNINQISATIQASLQQLWSFKSTTTTAGGATSVISITGLDLDTDGQYMGILDFKPAALSADLSLCVQTDYTATNYYTSKADSAAGSNVADITNVDVDTDYWQYVVFYMRKKAGEGAQALGHVCKGTTGTATSNTVFSWQTKLTDNVTSIQFKSIAAANIFPNGAKFSLWKKAWV